MKRTSLVACTGWEAQDASLRVVFASTARQTMTAVTGSVFSEPRSAVKQ